MFILIVKNAYSQNYHELKSLTFLEAKKEAEEIIHSLKVIVLQATVLKATEFERII